MMVSAARETILLRIGLSQRPSSKHRHFLWQTSELEPSRGLCANIRDAEPRSHFGTPEEPATGFCNLYTWTIDAHRSDSGCQSTAPSKALWCFMQQFPFLLLLLPRAKARSLPRQLPPEGAWPRCGLAQASLLVHSSAFLHAKRPQCEGKCGFWSVEQEVYSLSVFAKAVSLWGEAGSRPGAVAASQLSWARPGRRHPRHLHI